MFLLPLLSPDGQLGTLAITHGDWTAISHGRGSPRLKTSWSTVMSEGSRNDRDTPGDRATANTDSLRSDVDNELLDGVYEFDAEGRFVYCNASAKVLFGYRPDEDLNGLSVKDTIVNDDAPVSARDIERIFAGETVRGERTFLRRSGERFVGEVHSGPVFRDGRVVGVRGVLRDITARKETEERLRESELRLRNLFDLSPQPISVTELETGRLIDVNRRFCELSGYSRDEIMGRSTTEIGVVPPDRREQFAEELRTVGEVRGMPVQVFDRSGRAIETVIFARRITLSEQQLVLTVVVDLTEQRDLEARLLQAQKLEAIGTLAGGVAHDFNNILTVVGGLASLGLSQVERGHPVCELFNRIQEQVQSAASLTRQLMAYARTGRYEVVATDLNDLVRRSSELFARTHKGISLEVDLTPEACWAAVDRSQLEHALLNLYVNSAHAMPAGGRLRVATRFGVLDGAAARARELSAGRYVVVTVEDSGTGMDEATRSRVFDPFFTTKGMGRGTGLGLASVYGVIKGHDGAIDVWSEPGEGTRFEIYLPASEEGTEADEETARAQRTGHGLVLVVDDEVAVTEVTSVMLQHLGYEVLVANSGPAAIELFADRAQAVDLVVLDLVMPDMNGAAVFEELSRIRPDVPVLLFSGYSVESEAVARLRKRCRGVLQKPFTPQQLAESIASTLRARA